MRHYSLVQLFYQKEETFYNIKKALEKMTKLINEFQFTSFDRYILENENHLNKYNNPQEFNQ